MTRAMLLAAISVVAIATAVPSAGAQASSETLADSVSSALDNNPAIAANRKTRAQADEQLEQAKAAALPTVSVRGSYSVEDVKNGQAFTTPAGQSFPPQGVLERDSLGLDVRQTIYAGGSLGAQQRQARAGVTAASERLRGQEQQLVLDTVKSFVEVRRALSELEIRQSNVAELREEVRATSDRFNAGEVTRTDIAQAQSRAAAADSQVASARARLEAQRATFQRLVGRPPVQLAAPPAIPQLPGTLEEAISIALQDNPRLGESRATETSTEEAITVARSSLLPRIGLVGTTGIQDTYPDSRGTLTDRNSSVRAEVTIPLYQGGLASSKTRSARLENDRARLETKALERAVTEQVTAAWHNLIAARESITASQSQIDAARLALEGARQELTVGTRITLDVLDQENELLVAQLGQIDAESRAYVAAHDLLAAIGRLNGQAIGR